MSSSREGGSGQRGFQRRIPGEELAVLYLQRKGCTILTRNFRTPRGEVDIICEDHETVVFVEVKGWRTLGIPDLEHAISLKKRKRIVSTAQRYLADNKFDPPGGVRFDVVFVNTNDRRIEHFQGAFDSPWQG